MNFGPKPRDYAYNMPRKARQKALRSVLSLRLSENKLVVVDDFTTDGKTKSVVSTLAALGAAQPDNKALIVEVTDHDRCAFSGHQQRGFAADPTSGAGDQCGASREAVPRIGFFVLHPCILARANVIRIVSGGPASKPAKCARLPEA